MKTVTSRVFVFTALLMGGASLLGCETKASSSGPPSTAEIAKFKGTKPTEEELARRQAEYKRVTSSTPQQPQLTVEQQAQMQKMREEWAKKGNAPKVP